MFATWEQAENSFDDMLDETNEIEIMGMSYSASRVLKDHDPTAYRCMLMDYIDGEGIDSDDLTGECSV